MQQSDMPLCFRDSSNPNSRMANLTDRTLLLSMDVLHVGNANGLAVRWKLRRLVQSVEQASYVFIPFPKNCFHSQNELRTRRDAAPGGKSRCQHPKQHVGRKLVGREA